MVKRKTTKTKKEEFRDYPNLPDTRANNKFIVVAIIIVLIILFFLNVLISFLLDVPEAEKSSIEITKNANSFFSLENSTKIIMNLPAVDSEGNGVNTILEVEAVTGSGRTLTDIDNLLFWADTQHSIRVARRVAEDITGKKMQDYDIIYAINANASVIGGPSAGAAITLATIAALEGKRLSENVMITGAINHDGSIGPVSEILPKAKAAKQTGAVLFLVPLLQSRDVIYEISEHCETFGQSEICTSETKPKKVDVSAEAGIDIQEVETIEDAMKYFFE